MHPWSPSINSSNYMTNQGNGPIKYVNGSQCFYGINFWNVAKKNSLLNMKGIWENLI
ncbi:hypothetical protein SAMN03080594_1011194 [Arenibacter palladensis]|uniref:Uncharacterized protein n=1 Tax=Arenibacter palladensis TaxID=237373 RepID=A0A1M4W3T0_9FLAO|nr:hypothetical protein SAMN03080594_1011194 [Arenibacter palladensis]